VAAAEAGAAGVEEREVGGAAQAQGRSLMSARLLELFTDLKSCGCASNEKCLYSRRLLCENCIADISALSTSRIMLRIDENGVRFFQCFFAHF
jgi:hypothetical protein